MKNFILFSIIFTAFYACNPYKHRKPKYYTIRTSSPKEQSKKENTWVFLMAGQSNMAGRGLVEPQDTISNPRIWTINKEGKLIIAREPLHFYEPTRVGLDCGLSFAKTLLKGIPDSVTLLIIPTAVGGSSIEQWIGDSTYRDVKLLTNFRQKMSLAKQYGIVKGILWHQGEANASPKLIPIYPDNLKKLFTIFRSEANNSTLPVLIGELGSFSKSPNEWAAINDAIRKYVATDPNARIIKTGDFKHKGDDIHFNSEGQRMMGQRFADTFLSLKH